MSSGSTRPGAQRLFRGTAHEKSLSGSAEFNTTLDREKTAAAAGVLLKASWWRGGIPALVEAALYG
jgi:hypothetical protein